MSHRQESGSDRPRAIVGMDVAEARKTFDILNRIECEVGNDAAAQQARNQAIQAYLS
jgi:hypothetical protein